MEDEIQILFNNLRLMDVDLDMLQKQYKVPLNPQMFVKSNPKGMAVLLHTLICLFDDAAFRPLFSVCWFPYTLVELKEFKQIALQVCNDILARD
jgi:hypothetical protein